MRALNAKPKAELVSKIIDAIIINFIYYRHSNLNVCLPLLLPDVRIRYFFAFDLLLALFLTVTLVNYIFSLIYFSALRCTNFSLPL